MSNVMQTIIADLIFIAVLVFVIYLWYREEQHVRRFLRKNDADRDGEEGA
jgi:hypothetical protein